MDPSRSSETPQPRRPSQQAERRRPSQQAEPRRPSQQAERRRPSQQDDPRRPSQQDDPRRLSEQAESLQSPRQSESPQPSQPPQPPRQPISVLKKIKNIFSIHFRGIFGCIVPLITFPWVPYYHGLHEITILITWMWMFWTFLLQPVDIPVTGFIPLFLLPATGALSSASVCQCYFNENIALFLLAGMLLLLMNSTGADRRIAIWFLCYGDTVHFSEKRIMFKASIAAFILSMFSNRLTATSTIIECLMPALTEFQSSISIDRSTEPDYDELRYIIMNAIQTSSAIGSTAIMHSAFATLAMRAIWCENLPTLVEYSDIFNYAHWSAFAFPVAILIFILNCAYYTLLIYIFVRKPMSSSRKKEMREALLRQKSTLPDKVSWHEKLSIFFTFFVLVMLLFRGLDLILGWTRYGRETNPRAVPALVKDVTVVTFFIIALHMLPVTYGFVKIFTAKTVSDLGEIKSDSSIMSWNFMKKNTNFGYIFLLGSGVALNRAFQANLLQYIISLFLGRIITGHEWETSIFIVVLISVILANVMSGVAVVCLFLPFVLNMALPFISPTVWSDNVHLGAVAVGIGSSFGFMLPFLFTPAYFCHHTGRVPIKKMIKYSFGSVIICTLILWLALCFYAPVIWRVKQSPRIFESIPFPLPWLRYSKDKVLTGLKGRKYFDVMLLSVSK